MNDFPVLIGVSKIDAIKKLVELKVPYRITGEDGIFRKIGPDIRHDRINLVLKKDIVVSYEFY